MTRQRGVTETVSAHRELPKTLVSLQRVAPSINDETAAREVRRELGRDYAWAMDQGWTIEFWGVRLSGSAVKAYERFRVRGPRLPVRRLVTPMRAVIAWGTHFLLTLTQRRPGVLVAPTPWAGAGAAAGRILRRRPPPLVVRVQGRSASKALMVRRSRLRFHVIEALDRFVLRRADLVVPMGRYTAERAREIGVPDAKIIVLPFPPAWRDSPTQPPPEGPRLGQLVACGARLEREKGIDVLITAFREVLQRCPDARLSIAGDGPERDELEGLTERLGVRAQVEFRGWLPPTEMWKLFASAGVAVLPARWEEGLGMVLVEAGLAGCALVATDLGGMRDVVRPGESGLLVPPEDPGALANALIHCLTSPEDRARFASSAREIALRYVEQRDAALKEFSERMNEMRAG